MRTHKWNAGALLALVGALAAAPVLAAPSKEEITSMLRTIDSRSTSPGDYKALVYLEQKEKDKTDIVREALVYRRDADQKLIILFSKPKSEEGKGYLRLDKNLWSYDPNVGKWERRTERERIAGTDSRRADFDQSRLAEEYDAAYEGEEKLGAFTTHKVRLTAKPGVDVAYPTVVMWIEATNGNTLKRQDLALSGKLMRTSYYPKWRKLYSESKKGDMWYSEESRIYDEVEKANSTIILIKKLDLQALDPNLFTKAWLESKSR